MTLRRVINCAGSGYGASPPVTSHFVEHAHGFADSIRWPETSSSVRYALNELSLEMQRRPEDCAVAGAPDWPEPLKGPEKAARRALVDCGRISPAESDRRDRRRSGRSCWRCVRLGPC